MATSRGSSRHGGSNSPRKRAGISFSAPRKCAPSAGTNGLLPLSAGASKNRFRVILEFVWELSSQERHSWCNFISDPSAACQDHGARCPASQLVQRQSRKGGWENDYFD